jgi:alpha-1,2-mannosyltransferase
VEEKARDSMEVSPAVHGRRLLLFVLASLTLAYALPLMIYHLVHVGTPGSIKGMVVDFWHVRQATDSWLPMMKSLDYFRDHPTEPIYAAHLYDTLIYPLASLLPMLGLRKAGVSDATMLRLLAVGSVMAVFGVGLLALAMGRRLLAVRGARLDGQTIAAVMIACLTSYPLLKGYQQGNAQTFLSLGFALLMYLWVCGRERTGGVVAAMLAFVKPQFVLLLVWMALRRRWGALVSALACAALLGVASVAVFGWHNNLDYLGVLASLSHKAQSHYANQSMFGTLNRMIFNGENLGYHPYVYTPYVAWVYQASVATALLLVAVVLAWPWGTLRGSAADLGAMGIVSVAASPMAWEHHYGIVFGVLAWAWFAHYSRQQQRPWLLAICFFLTMNFLSFFNLLSNVPVLNILQSYLYFGALATVAMLMRMAKYEPAL